MQQAFCIANRKETIIDLGNTKNAVGNEVIKGSTRINLDFNKETETLERRPSIIIRITQFILMLTITLAVTMTIINGILYITKSGNGEDPRKIRWNLVYIAVGILVALFSVVIVNVLRSVLNEETLEEQETVSLEKTVIYDPSEGPTKSVVVTIGLDKMVYIPQGRQGIEEWEGKGTGLKFQKTYTNNIEDNIHVTDTNEYNRKIPLKITRIE
jgi:hypothetical protein